VIFKTDLEAPDILKICLDTEIKLGRERNALSGYSDRVIDIDILYIDDLVLNDKQLIIPHPRLQDRLFALVPLCEVIPEFIHPVLQKSNKSLLSLCPDNTIIEKLD
jgi:2-amino-4-hydroxy-6-hydroxymethyldihydropteridine diphosphokinase